MYDHFRAVFTRSSAAVTATIAPGQATFIADTPHNREDQQRVTDARSCRLQDFGPQGTRTADPALRLEWTTPHQMGCECGLWS
jgi:hypothetical protein